MEQLLELFSNPIALFILIGVISSIFNKAKGNVQEQQQRPVRPSRPLADMRRQAEAKQDPRYDNRRNTQPGTGHDQRRGAKPEPRQNNRRESVNSPRPVQPIPVKAERDAEVLGDLQKVYQERKQQSQTGNQNQRAAERGRMSTENTGRMRQQRSEKEPEIDFQPDRERLVEGLIWSEVLGKPRAKKPYHPGRRY
ncbi:hypothetical protein M3204_06055 [Mesobacillus subterraneus]|uniref:hypothetical protein n=1 Tax=Mesobacillus subterraneus TaxID=285983 RepID=UPI00203A48F1|nr:hypothetical protein [Mesobacillus subterraneus]MCM3663958.1 hypothetical protein [Mesobacillus subterraneus]MCM3683717.1 hypothetical protein [Mesobacillus subterraneus]